MPILNACVPVMYDTATRCAPRSVARLLAYVADALYRKLFESSRIEMWLGSTPGFRNVGQCVIDSDAPASRSSFEVRGAFQSP